MTDAPQMRFLSTNVCPNSGPDWMFGNDCSPSGLTIWGYCGTCWLWQESRIPRSWLHRLAAEGNPAC